MSGLAPGLLGEVAGNHTSKVFLGSVPNLVIEKRLVKSMQSVYPWYTTRKRSKDAANEYLDLDLASRDVENFLTHSHVFWTRKQVHGDSMDALYKVVGSAKLPKQSESGVLSALDECRLMISDRTALEEKKMAHAKKWSKSELEPTADFETWDIMHYMKEINMTAAGDPHCEWKARSFLPQDRVMDAAYDLVEDLIPADLKRPAAMLDRKEEKLIQKFIGPDYASMLKVGTVEKINPSEVTTAFRAIGERMVNPKLPSFTKSIVGHIFRRYAMQPSHLCSLSQYWSILGDVDKNPGQTTMPLSLAQAVCTAQLQNRCTKFQLLHQYSSDELSKQTWRNSNFVPLLRLFPHLGYGVSEDLLAGTLVDHLFEKRLKLDLTSTANLLEEETVREVQAFISEVVTMRESNPEGLFSRYKEQFKEVMKPTLSEEETKWLEDFATGRLDPDYQAGKGKDGVEVDDDEYEEVYVLEEGEPESEPLDGENFGEATTTTTSDSTASSSSDSEEGGSFKL